MTAASCKSCKTICGDCPRPRLLPDAVPQVLAYLACGTQWRIGPMGSRIGLDYAGCRAALEVHHPGAKPRRLRRLFAGVQEVESALLTVQREIHDASATTQGVD